MIKGQKKSEIILYMVLWTFLFAAPLVSMLVDDFEWQIVFYAWSLLAMFCITPSSFTISSSPLCWFTATESGRMPFPRWR